MRRRFTGRIAIPIIVVVLLAATAVYRVPTTFSMNAVTQLVQLEPSADHRSPWYFAGATLYDGDGSTRPFTGSVLIKPGTRAVLDRIGTGPFSLVCRSLVPGAVVASLRPADGSRPVEILDYLMLVVDHPARSDAGSEQAMVLPVIGKIQVGSEVGLDLGDQPALLQRGTVTLLAHTLVGERLYQAGSTALELGDYPQMEQLGDARGLLVVDSQPHITASFRVIARSLRISRFGSAGYDVYASLFERVKNDHVLQGIWAASILVLTWMVKGRNRVGRQDDSIKQEVRR